MMSTEPIKIALKKSSGHYVTVDSGANLLAATSSTCGNNEIFQLVYQQDMIFALQAFNGKYVTIKPGESNSLAAISDTVGENENFEMFNWHSDEQIVLLAANKMYVDIKAAGAILQANSLNPTDDDIFEIIPLDQSGNPLPLNEPDTLTEQPSVHVLKAASAGSPPSVFTVCFSGTACTRDEGEVSRPGSDKNIYCPNTGYIPVRIHKEISGSLRAVTPSISVRGVGENDWAVPRNDSEPLVFNGPLDADSSLLNYVKSYSGGNQYSYVTQLDGWSAPALALHGANIACKSGKQQFNFIGHSRGAVECIMAAWFIYAYGSEQLKKIPINIFAIDPVPGTGQWYSMLTQLPPNVVNYVGVYAWDMCIQPGDKPFMALVPRPNGLMTGKDNTAKIYNSVLWWDRWKYIADNAQLTDPLEKGNYPQPVGYTLYAIRGRHSTVAGNYTADAKYDAANVSASVAPVPELIYKMARGYLTQWGTVFPTASAVSEEVVPLRQAINTDHRDFDTMGGGETRTSSLPYRPYVRRVSSIYGINPANSYYMDNVVGNPPYSMAYPVTNERTDAGWVKWTFL
ncbi:MAG: hypothetical protein E6470_11415 [Enterobacteriaceae bacterium]|uniref:Fascin domain-containing protein n=1 Tax=Kluyvera intermedia TaxID=61648 RepID=A0ABX3UHF8_KLUIN|nr:hypothetical protein [Kluyvera intermedia]MDU6684210.1 hypothetical protein [Enterobacteriaceae bacterium]ORJ50903.1 hypothetical protein B2M27_07150 [Kluyvera intermedia]